MGLYDTLTNGENVKCFYSITFWKDDLIAEENNGFGSTTHIGGSLRKFKVGDKLPISTKYYEYPLNFCIFDFRVCEKEKYNTNAVHVVKDGIYVRYIPLRKVQETDISDYWIDNFGRQINIKCKDDIKKIQDDFKEEITQKRAIIVKYGAQKILDKLKYVVNSPDEFERLMKEYEEVYSQQKTEMDTINIIKKWYVPDMYAKEKQFGEFWEVYSNEYSQIKEENIQERSYFDFKDAFRNFLNKNPDIIKKYFIWKNTCDKDEIDKFVECLIQGKEK